MTTDSLAPVVESLEQVAEPFRGLYEERDGAFVARVNVREHPDTLALQKALREERASVDVWKKQARDFAALGLTIEQVADLKREHENLKTTSAQLQEQLAAVVPEHTQLKAKIETQELRRQITETFLGAGGIETDVSLVLLEVGDRFTRDADGALVLLDEKGEPTETAPADWFHQTYKNQRAKFFKGTGASGSGAGSFEGDSKPTHDTRNMTGAQMVNAALTG